MSRARLALVIAILAVTPGRAAAQELGVDATRLAARLDLVRGGGTMWGVSSTVLDLRSAAQDAPSPTIAAPTSSASVSPSASPSPSGTSRPLTGAGFIVLGLLLGAFLLLRTRLLRRKR